MNKKKGHKQRAKKIKLKTRNGDKRKKEGKNKKEHELKGKKERD